MVSSLSILFLFRFHPVVSLLSISPILVVGKENQFSTDNLSLTSLHLNLAIMAVLDLIITPYLPVILLVLYYAVPYFTTNKALRAVPGPFFASISNLWLLLQARQGKRYLSVHAAHKKYGKLVRIQPDHVSVADDSAINAIYGHGNGFLKRFVDSPRPRIS